MLKRLKAWLTLSDHNQREPNYYRRLIRVIRPPLRRPPSEEADRRRATNID